MAIKQRRIELFWTECTNLFSKIDEISLGYFLQQLIGIVKKYDKDLEKLIVSFHRYRNFQFGDAEKEFLDFIIKMNIEKFIIGSTGDNFNLIVTNYLQQPPLSDIDAWRRISNLIRDLITYTSEVVCPQCKSDYLCVFTDSNGTKLYKYCQTCFFTESEGYTIQGQVGLFPADKNALLKGGFLKK